MDDSTYFWFFICFYPNRNRRCLLASESHCFICV